MLRHLFLPVIAFAVAIGLFTQLYRVRVLIDSYRYSSSPAKNELLSDSYLRRVLMADGNVDNDNNTGIWFNKPVKQPRQLAERLMEPATRVLGDNSDEKWIEIDLDRQLLYAHEGVRTIYTFPISSGMPWFPTVTGEFKVWARVLATRMTGGSVKDGSFYDLPNVPYVMYFYKGYAIHGAYWHNDFGKPRSHGCVNLSVDNARILYFWSKPVTLANETASFGIDPKKSTRIVINGTTPTNVYN